MSPWIFFTGVDQICRAAIVQIEPRTKQSKYFRDDFNTTLTDDFGMVASMDRTGVLLLK